jgi:hypothetical protein
MGIQPPDDPSCLETSACGCGAVGTDGSTLLSDGVLDRDDWTKATWARWQGKREQRRNTWRIAWSATLSQRRRYGRWAGPVGRCAVKVPNGAKA